MVADGQPAAELAAQLLDSQPEGRLQRWPHKPLLGPVGIIDWNQAPRMIVLKLYNILTYGRIANRLY